MFITLNITSTNAKFTSNILEAVEKYIHFCNVHQKENVAII